MKGKLGIFFAVLFVCALGTVCSGRIAAAAPALPGSGDEALASDAQLSNLEEMEWVKPGLREVMQPVLHEVDLTETVRTLRAEITELQEELAGVKKELSSKQKAWEQLEEDVKVLKREQKRIGMIDVFGIGVSVVAFIFVLFLVLPEIFKSNKGGEKTTDDKQNGGSEKDPYGSIDCQENGDTVDEGVNEDEKGGSVPLGVDSANGSGTESIGADKENAEQGTYGDREPIERQQEKAPKAPRINEEKDDTEEKADTGIRLEPGRLQIDKDNNLNQFNIRRSDKGAYTLERDGRVSYDKKNASLSSMYRLGMNELFWIKVNGKIYTEDKLKDNRLKVKICNVKDALVNEEKGKLIVVKKGEMECKG